MRENFTYGSVRGAAGNGGPYRDRRYATKESGSCRYATNNVFAFPLVAV